LTVGEHGVRTAAKDFDVIDRLVDRNSVVCSRNDRLVSPKIGEPACCTVRNGASPPVGSPRTDIGPTFAARRLHPQTRRNLE
jgi:hypothetical protein